MTAFKVGDVVSLEGRVVQVTETGLVTMDVDGNRCSMFDYRFKLVEAATKPALKVGDVVPGSASSGDSTLGVPVGSIVRGCGNRWDYYRGYTGWVVGGRTGNSPYSGEYEIVYLPA